MSLARTLLSAAVLFAGATAQTCSPGYEMIDGACVDTCEGLRADGTVDVYQQHVWCRQLTGAGQSCARVDGNPVCTCNAGRAGVFTGPRCTEAYNVGGGYLGLTFTPQFQQEVAVAWSVGHDPLCSHEHSSGWKQGSNAAGVLGSCLCKEGWEGPKCKVEIGAATACDANPCQNAGVCSNDAAATNGYTCACTADWTGATCEEPVDRCTPNPCTNDGTCTNDAAATSGFTCACKLGWKGETCSEVDTPCVLDPCSNGGVCSDSDVCTGNPTDKGCDKCSCKNQKECEKQAEKNQDKNDKEAEKKQDKSDKSDKNDGRDKSDKNDKSDKSDKNDSRDKSDKNDKDKTKPICTWSAASSSCLVKYESSICGWKDKYQCTCPEGFTGKNCEFETGNDKNDNKRVEGAADETGPEGEGVSAGGMLLTGAVGIVLGSVATAGVLMYRRNQAAALTETTFARNQAGHELYTNEVSPPSSPSADVYAKAVGPNQA